MMDEKRDGCQTLDSRGRRPIKNQAARIKLKA